MVPHAQSWGGGLHRLASWRCMKGGTLYTGVTCNPAGRIWQHKTYANPGTSSSGSDRRFSPPTSSGRQFRLGHGIEFRS